MVILVTCSLSISKLKPFKCLSGYCTNTNFQTFLPIIYDLAALKFTFLNHEVYLTPLADKSRGRFNKCNKSNIKWSSITQWLAGDNSKNIILHISSLFVLAAPAFLPNQSPSIASHAEAAHNQSLCGFLVKKRSYTKCVICETKWTARNNIPTKNCATLRNRKPPRSPMACSQSNCGGKLPVKYIYVSKFWAFLNCVRTRHAKQMLL